MKKTQSTIPLSDRKEWAKDPFYKTCALRGLHGHECGGSITWEHAMIYAGKKMQDKWSVVPLCERAHAVNSYQDAGTMVKELNQWVALNRATDDQLKAISKAEDYIRTRSYLNGKYGVWKMPVFADSDKVPEVPLVKILVDYKLGKIKIDSALFMIENGLYITK